MSQLNQIRYNENNLSSTQSEWTDKDKELEGIQGLERHFLRLWN